MSKYICYSLYGNNPLYTLGAIENSRLAQIIYPDWEVIIFIRDNLDKSIRYALKKYNVRLVTINERYANELDIISKCTFWRYYLISDKDAEYIIFRDCDSRLSYKEKAAVYDWIDSGTDFHLLYDHIEHTTEILGGLWGIKGNVIGNIKKLIGEFIRKNDRIYRNRRDYDQMFLKHVIWPNYVKKMSYVAHGNIKECQYHIEKGINITPYPKMEEPLFIDSCINLTTQEYIGQTITCPYWQHKPQMNKNTKHKPNNTNKIHNSHKSDDPPNTLPLNTLPSNTLPPDPSNTLPSDPSSTLTSNSSSSTLPSEVSSDDSKVDELNGRKIDELNNNSKINELYRVKMDELCRVKVDELSRAKLDEWKIGRRTVELNPIKPKPTGIGLIKKGDVSKMSKSLLDKKKIIIKLKR
jgi:hypothetical protein